MNGWPLFGVGIASFNLGQAVGSRFAEPADAAWVAVAILVFVGTLAAVAMDRLERGSDA